MLGLNFPEQVFYEIFTVALEYSVLFSDLNFESAFTFA